MGAPANMPPKSPTSHLHVINLVVALLAGVISITGGIYTLKNNFFSGPAYGSLQGTVRDERIARPLKLASVEISDLSGAVVNTETTDDNGHYFIEALKTGNYVVTFKAPLHKIETKTIKIEKNLASSISVDLFPEAPPVNLFPVESAAQVRQNIQAPYVPRTTYQTAVPAALVYNSSQNIPATPAASSTYSQGEPVPAPSFSGLPQTGFRRHHRRNYSGEPVDSPSGTSQSASQGSALTQAGAQLLQAWLSKKSENSQATSSASSTSATSSN